MFIRTTRPFIKGQVGLRRGIERFLVDAHELPELTVDERIDVIEGAVAFLAESLLPHARAHERIISPEVDRILGIDGSAAYVAYDRALIRQRIRELSDADPTDVGRIQQILYALHMLATGIESKEEEDLFRLARVETPRSVERLFERVGGYERALVS